VAALRCTDPSDQKFVDLALSVSGTWLFSRDRAVLKLARRAAPLGCRIVEPGRWAGQAEAFTSARRPGP
jgi:predicted nucleic acid-binding protein